MATRPATPHRQMAAASRPARRDSRRARSYGSPVISSTGSLSRAPPKHTRMPDHRVRQPGPAQNQAWSQAVIATPRPVPDMVTSIGAFVEGGR